MKPHNSDDMAGAAIDHKQVQLNNINGRIFLSTEQINAQILIQRVKKIVTYECFNWKSQNLNLVDGQYHVEIRPLSGIMIQ